MVILTNTSIDNVQLEEILKLVKSLAGKRDEIQLFSNHMMKEYTYATNVDMQTEELMIATERIKKKDFEYIKKYIIEMSSNN